MRSRFVGHVKMVTLNCKLLLSDEITNKFGRVDIHADNEMRFVGHVNVIEIVKLLLSDEVTNKFGKVNIHIDNEYAFRWACSNGHIEIVKLLLSDEITNKFGK